MKELLLQEKYPVYYLEINKADTSFTNTDTKELWVKSIANQLEAAA